MYMYNEVKKKCKIYEHNSTEPDNKENSDFFRICNNFLWQKKSGKVENMYATSHKITNHNRKLF